MLTKVPNNSESDTLEMHPEIPWSSVIGARNIVMRAYEYLKPELIQEMAENDIPVLVASLPPYPESGA